MEPPPPITSTAAATTTTGDTIDSTTAISDDSSPKLRLMCSYGGHIVPRPHDKSLCYVGGDTRIVVVDRRTTLVSLVSRLSDLLLDGKPFALKYQIPSEDLDSLITVSTDEDLENMIDEYDRIVRPGRLRIFLFGESAKGAGSVVEAAKNGDWFVEVAKNGDWFVEALNGGLGAGMAGIGLRRGFSDPNSVNCLLGLEEKVIVESDQGKPKGKSGENGSGNGNSYQDVHSVPDSPMIETTSSFGSTSSSPSNANVAPARVSGDDGGGGGEVSVSDHRIGGIEEQFSELRVGVDVQVKQDDDLSVMPAPVIGAAVGARSEEYVNRVVSDDERSDQGVPMVYRKAAVAQNVQVMVPSQSQQKIAGGGGSDLPSPDSVASDSSLSGVLSRQKSMIYQEPSGQTPASGNRLATDLVDAKAVDASEPRILVQMQQYPTSSYGLASHHDLQQQKQQLLQQQQQHQLLQQQQHQQQLLQQQQQHQLLQQQQQQHQLLQHKQQQQQLLQHEQQHQLLQHKEQQQQQQQQTQPFIQVAPQYAHLTPAGGSPFSTYYPIYASQHPQLHHHQGQYPMFYMPAGQPQAYNFPETANVMPASGGQAPPNPTMMSMSSSYNPTRNLVAQKSEMAGGVYMTAAGGAPPHVQVPSNQHLTQQQHQQHQQHFVGYSHIHHPSQSIAPASDAAGSYAYETADQAKTHLYYPPQVLQPQMAAPYHTVTSPPAVVSANSSAQIPTDSVKQQA